MQQNNTELFHYIEKENKAVVPYSPVYLLTLK